VRALPVPTAVCASGGVTRRGILGVTTPTMPASSVKRGKAAGAVACSRPPLPLLPLPLPGDPGGETSSKVVIVGVVCPPRCGAKADEGPPSVCPARPVRASPEGGQAAEVLGRASDDGESEASNDSSEPSMSKAAAPAWRGAGAAVVARRGGD